MLVPRENSSRRPRRGAGVPPSEARAAFHSVDSLRPRRIHQTTAATRNRWKKTRRAPSSPSGAVSTTASRNPTTGPADHASWAAPTCLARWCAGASSAM